MATRNSSRPPPPTEALPKLYPEDGELTGGHAFHQALRPGGAPRLVEPVESTKLSPTAPLFSPESGRTIPAPPGSQPSELTFPPGPITARHLGDDDPSEEIPNLASGEEDGTSTDQTALMRDLSCRTGDRATLSVLTGLSAGQVIPLDIGTVTIGRGKEAQVVLRDAGISRIHVRITSHSKGIYLLEDLRSTNGVRVNGVGVKSYTLRVGDRVQLGPTLVLQFAYLDDTEEALNRQLYEAATRDPLTQALNRRAFDERLLSECAHARRHNTLLSVILCDVDHFKRVNDTFGHPTGDRVLRAIAQVAQREVRRDDLFARYGGEEFVIMVRGEVLEKTALLAERLRLAVKDLAVRDEAGKLVRVTLSAGLAAFHECGSSAEPAALLALADQRLYRAKEQGRDRLCVR